MSALQAQAPALALQVQSLALSLGGRPVLRGIDLSLPHGQTLALLGPSGCGKTTLLRLIAGLAEPDAGAVHIAGRTVVGLPPQARGVGMMFQSYALFPNLSVADNIAFGPLAQGWTRERAQERTQELLALIDLADHAHKRPAQLSGGQRQRVAMARALAPQPALLLMDEPFSAIDESFRVPLRRSFRQLMQGLSQSCVMVTHDREEAFELADLVAVMLDGQLARLDTPAQLLRQPGSVAVARFLGAFNHFPPAHAGLGLPPLPEGGQWVAPMSSLRQADAAGNGGSPGWYFKAEVIAVYTGLHGAQIELRTVDGFALTLLDAGAAVPAVGQTLSLQQPVDTMVALPC